MKNDFDFLKEKFDNDGVNAPVEMNTDFVMNKLEGKSPKVVKFPKKAIAGVVSGLVACVAVFAIVVTSTNTPIVKEPAPIIAEAGELEAFDDYESLKATLKEMGVSSKLEYNVGMMTESFSMGFDSIKGEATATYDEAVSDSASSSNFGETYKQVSDVDEADIIKTDGKYIYVLTENKVNIYSAKGDESKLITTKKIRDDNIYGDVEMFLHNNNLIIIATNYEKDKTTAYIYDKSNVKDVKLIDKFSQSGTYSSSRMIGDNLYIVTDDYIETYNDIPYVVCKDEDIKLSADSIVCVEKPSHPAYLVVSKIDTANMKSSTKNYESKAILGASKNIYCNLDNMYITSTVYRDYYEGDEEDEIVVDEVDGDVVEINPVYNDQTQIVKVSLKDGIKFVATTKIEGYIDSQYSMDEKDGYFRIATTSNNEKGVEVNNLLVFDEKLNEVGSVSGFAPTESIKAVKYIGDTAYVITYEQTDPLFVIDLKNPRKPTILGECKISGFSTMLVPIGEDRLMGIGYYTQEEDYTDMEVQEGIKIALFDISDITNPKVLDEQVFKGYSSEVQYQPKALVYDAEKDTYFIPYDTCYFDSGKYSTGVLGIKIDGKEIAPATRYKVSTDEYNTIYRCTFVDDYLYMFNFNGDLYTSKMK